MPAAREGQWGHHSKGQARAEPVPKGCWKLGTVKPRQRLRLGARRHRWLHFYVGTQRRQVWYTRSCLRRGPVALGDECSHVARLAWAAAVPIGVLYLYMGAVGADGSGLFDEWVARWTHADAVMCWCLTWCVDAFEGSATCCGDARRIPALQVLPAWLGCAVHPLPRAWHGAVPVHVAVRRQSPA